MNGEPPQLAADAPVVGNTYADLVADARAVADALAGDPNLGYYLDLRDAHPLGVAADGTSLRWSATARIVIPAYSSTAF